MQKLLIDEEKADLYFNGRRVPLTKDQLRGFSCLARAEGQVVPFSTFSEHVWGEFKPANQIRSLIDTMHQILRKQTYNSDLYLKTFFSKGYVLYDARLIHPHKPAKLLDRQTEPVPEPRSKAIWNQPEPRSKAIWNQPEPHLPPWYDLTKKEWEIFMLLAEPQNKYLTYPELACMLDIKYNTMKCHTRRIYRKLGVSTRNEVTELALRAKNKHTMTVMSNVERGR